MDIPAQARDWWGQRTGRQRLKIVGAVAAAALVLIASCAGGGYWYFTRPVRLEGVVQKFDEDDDGDTFDLLVGEEQPRRIRVWGVDCPERKNGGVQPWSDIATQATRRRIEGEQVVVELVATDQYDHDVGRVFYLDSAGEQHDLGLALVEDGLAWHYVRSAPDAVDLAAAEAAARARPRGLWLDDTPKPPWEWRTDE
jgi:endonuclease YncB( thermonuclease family)